MLATVEVHAKKLGLSIDGFLGMAVAMIGTPVKRRSRYDEVCDTLSSTSIVWQHQDS